MHTTKEIMPSILGGSMQTSEEMPSVSSFFQVEDRLVGSCATLGAELAIQVE